MNNYVGFIVGVIGLTQECPRCHKTLYPVIDYMDDNTIGMLPCYDNQTGEVLCPDCGYVPREIEGMTYNYNNNNVMESSYEMEQLVSFLKKNSTKSSFSDTYIYPQIKEISLEKVVFEKTYWAYMKKNSTKFLSIYDFYYDSEKFDAEYAKDGYSKFCIVEEYELTFSDNGSKFKKKYVHTGLILTGV